MGTEDSGISHIDCKDFVGTRMNAEESANAQVHTNNQVTTQM